VLSNKQTIAFGFTVYSSFESSEVSSTGIVPLPVEGEGVLGGHEVLLVGYLKDYPEHGLVRNSWGSGWGLGGYCLMPWQMIANPYYADDWRSIYRPA
jgi:C1A family cysteine protease